MTDYSGLWSIVFVSHAINLGSACKLQKAVLKGVITGCNIRCFCPSCNGSKVCSLVYKLLKDTDCLHFAILRLFYRLFRLITSNNMLEAPKNTLLTTFT